MEKWQEEHAEHEVARKEKVDRLGPKKSDKDDKEN
jgi:hypothetical protein